MKIRIWDLPTRLFHWLLVMAVIGSFVSVKLGGNTMIWYSRFGYLVLTLIFFRLIWGFVGTHHARFAHFIRSPKAILAYLKNPVETPGHSPVGAISVLFIGWLIFDSSLGGIVCKRWYCLWWATGKVCGVYLGRAVDIISSLEWMGAAGFGGDAHWRHFVLQIYQENQSHLCHDHWR